MPASAWASEHGIALGQVVTEEKSNEITAIPLLLKQIELNKVLITIDAMGCQKDIARDIVAGGGDFVIAVKDNQPKLLDAIQAHFWDHLERDLEDLRYRYHETLDDGHGRPSREHPGRLHADEFVGDRRLRGDRGYAAPMARNPWPP